MKKIHFLSCAMVLASIVMLNSCSEDGETEMEPGDNQEQVEDDSIVDSPPEQVTYFTFTVGNIDFQENSERWVILHDENGRLLDFKPYDSEDFLEFTKRSDSLPNSLIVTLFSYGSQPNPNFEVINHGMTTFSDIAVNSDWEFGMYSSSTNKGFENEIKAASHNGNSTAANGSFQFTLNGIQSPDYLEQNLFSSKNGRVSNGYSIENDNSGFLTYFYDFVAIPDDANDFIYSRIDNEENLKYYLLENVQDGDVIEVDQGDFVFYDEYLDIPFETNTFYEASVEAYEDDQDFFSLGGYLGYQLLNTSTTNTPLDNPFIRPGYLDRFNKYRTEIKLGGNNYLYHFLLHGEKPNAVGPPVNLDFSITDNSLKGFQFETSVPFVQKMVGFNSTSNQGNTTFLTNWLFISNANQNPAIEIPLEISSRYPNIDIAGLQYSFTELSLTFSKTYQQLIEEYEDNDKQNSIESFEKIRFF